MRWTTLPDRGDPVRIAAHEAHRPAVRVGEDGVAREQHARPVGARRPLDDGLAAEVPTDPVQREAGRDLPPLVVELDERVAPPHPLAVALRHEHRHVAEGMGPLRSARRTCAGGSRPRRASARASARARALRRRRSRRSRRAGCPRASARPSSAARCRPRARPAGPRGRARPRSRRCASRARAAPRGWSSAGRQPAPTAARPRRRRTVRGARAGRRSRRRTSRRSRSPHHCGPGCPLAPPRPAVGAGGCTRDPSPARRRRAAVCRCAGRVHRAAHPAAPSRPAPPATPTLAKAIAALRKPTVAAWALNHFVREHGDELDDFRAFAELLREAQRTLDAEQLRVLGRERAKRVDAVAERVARGGGGGGSAARRRRRPGGPRHASRRSSPTRAPRRPILTGALVRALCLLRVRLRRHRGRRRRRRRTRRAARPARPALEVLQGGGEGGEGRRGERHRRSRGAPPRAASSGAQPASRPSSSRPAPSCAPPTVRWPC